MLRIESVLIDPGGEVVGRQSKVHLFRQEKERAYAGLSYSLVDINGVKAGIIVCYDNVFPEVARTLAVMGADLLFLPSRIVAEGLEPWRLYILTRALENRIPIVAPNVYVPPAFPGGSIIVDVEETGTRRVVIPRVVREIHDGPGVAVYGVDLERTRRLRSERLGERRPETYGSLVS
jgi:predicted amidohydrolase